MKDIIICGIAAALIFIGFIGLLIVGLIRKKRVWIVYSLLLFFISILTGAFAGYKFVSKSYNRVSEIFKPRTGGEIYAALFDKPQSDCVEIIRYQDQVVPKIDYAIWLHFYTCPQELGRILGEKDFTVERVSTAWMNSTGPSAGDDWFKPELLGDTILLFNHKLDEYGNGQTLFSKLDSTEVYCKDVLD